MKTKRIRTKRAPCLNCEKRFPACHDTCADYREWHDKAEAERQNQRKDSEMEGYIKTSVSKTLHIKSRRSNRK